MAGCATGEEAYSLAIVVHEQLAKAHKHCPVQIFATDINEQGLDACRAGIYPQSVSADFSPERLHRHFVRLDDHTYQVTKTLRESVAFAAQDLIADPPFSRLDLIVCRNLLIYLEPEVQKKIFGLFHFALTPGGGLFLGSSESIGRQDDLFAPINKKWHLYRRVGPARRGAPPFPVDPSRESPHARAGATGSAPRRERNFAEIGRRLLLEEYAPASVLVNRQQEILFLHGPTGRYLQLPSGEPALNLLDMAPGELGTKVRAALHRTTREDRPASIGGIKLPRNGHTVSVRVTVKPVRSDRKGEGLFLVTFEDEPEQHPTALASAETDEGDDREAIIRQMEHELQATREDLQTTLEEVEASNEELKASNEEVTSVNEELETSKEELQSLNEELNTVNSQLRDKIEELEATNNDLANLLACTDIATLFLDTDFRIKRFTPVMTRLFHLIPSDLGRPLGDLAQKFTDDDLLADAQAVLDDLAPVEKEVRTAGGHSYLRRILPYRTHGNRIEGVVVTFIDVTKLRQAMDEARTHARQRAALAGLGLRGLTVLELRPLMAEAAQAVADTLGVELVEVLWLQEDGLALRLEGGVGWEPDQVGRSAVAIGTGSQAGYTLQYCKPVLVEDHRQEKRFRLSPLLAEHGAVSGLTVVIHSDHTPYGVLGAHTKHPRSFTQDDVHFLQAVANVLAQSLNRHHRDEELRKVNNSLEQRVEERTALMRLLRDVALAANDAETVEAALGFALRRICEHNGWELGQVYEAVEGGGALVPTNLWYSEREQAHARSRQASLPARIDPGRLLPGRVLQTRSAHWVKDIAQDEEFRRRPGAVEGGLRAAIAFPVFIGQELTHVLEFFSREALDPRPDMLEAMVVVGTQLGRVVERHRLQAELAEAVWQEQQWLAQQLHDTVGQELTGLGMLARGLESQLRAQQAPLSESLAEVVRGLQSATAQVREIARGLFPVDLDEEGLQAALTTLAQITQERHGISCTLEWEDRGLIQDARVRRHLYHIAQEAITNAVKHSQCHRIEIGFTSDRDRLRLEVRDDGVGIAAKRETFRGIGLRIMHYRASLAGGRLDVRPAEGGGTVVRCTLSKVEPHEQET